MGYGYRPRISDGVKLFVGHTGSCQDLVVLVRMIVIYLV